MSAFRLGRSRSKIKKQRGNATHTNAISGWAGYLKLIYRGRDRDLPLKDSYSLQLVLLISSV